MMTRDDIQKRVIEVAAKSTALKRKVGAVIAIKFNDNEFSVIASGFNHNMEDVNAPCEDEKGNTLDGVIHAEAAAFANLKISVDNTMVMFVSHEPCAGCKAHLEAKGLKYEVVGNFMKFDSNKPRVALVPPSLILGVAKVLSYGAKKYKVNNWRNTPDIESYISATQRHFLAWLGGEENDPESGLHHLEHAACNIAFLLELKHLPKVREK